MTDNPKTTDDAFLDAMGFKPSDFTSFDHKAIVLQRLAPQRPILERMLGLKMEVDLYEAGLGPKPSGVLLDYDRRRKRT